MGGKGSGGHRSGTGEKPSEARVLGLIGPSGGGVASLPPTVEIACPAGLSPEIAAIWAELSPFAINARTLVPSTVSAFLRLCQSIVKHAQMMAKIEEDGLTFLKYSVDPTGTEHAEPKAHPLISRAHALDGFIRSGMKDFAINPFGKPVVEPAAKPVDPFAQFKVKAG